jgi:hypothetical protein
MQADYFKCPVISVVFYLAFILQLIFPVSLNAADVKCIYPERLLVGSESPPVVRGGDTNMKIFSPSRLNPIGTVIDSTMYDFQCNATIHSRIAAIGDSALHFTAMISHDVGFITRGMKYFYYGDSAFFDCGYVVHEVRGGFGSLVDYYGPDRGIGNVAVMTTNTDWEPGWLSFQGIMQGTCAFTLHEGPWGPDPCDKFYWPSLYVMNDPDGNMAMVGMTFPGDSCSGGFQDIKVTHKTFDSSAWEDPILLDTLDDPSAWIAGPDIPMIAGADNGHMGIVTADFGTNVYYWESTDSGITWGDRINITGFPTVPHYVPPDTLSQEYRPLQNAAIAFSPDGIPHVVWTAYQARGNSSDSLYTPGSGSLWQYRTRLEHWDPINGITTVYRHPVGLSDYAMGTTFAYNVGHPTIGFSQWEDIIFVAYEGFVDSDQDLSNGCYFGDIYVSLSNDGGLGWEERVNITSSPGSDDLYPSITRINPEGLLPELDGFSVGSPNGYNDFVMVYQNDDRAGTWVHGEEPSANWDMILVAPVDFGGIKGIGGDGSENISGIPKAYNLSQNYPNPFNPSTTIKYRVPETDGEGANVCIEVFDIRGRKVRTLIDKNVGSGQYSIQWNGRGDQGEAVSSGIYLYRLKTGDFQQTRRMLMLK